MKNMFAVKRAKTTTTFETYAAAAAYNRATLGSMLLKYNTVLHEWTRV